MISLSAYQLRESQEANRTDFGSEKNDIEEIRDKEIRHCFFSADKSKMVNCVSAPASAQHIEAPINTNNNLPCI